jgi:transcription elongation factor GreB
LTVCRTTAAKCFFGAWVTIENDDGSAHTYRLVGADEFDLSRGYLSIDAPMARALLGKRIDDEVSVRTPEGFTRTVITDIRYDPLPPVK